jgi:cytochrome b561
VADTWSRAQRRLHWSTALLIVLGFALAWVMVAVPLQQMLEKFLLFQIHKTIGLTVFGLIIWRLALRLRRGRPPLEPDLPRWQRIAASAMHAALYSLALVVPILGYFTAATAPARIPTLFMLVLPVPHAVGPDKAAYEVLRLVHRGAAIALITLAVGHALAAFYNHAKGRPTLVRMWAHH